MRQEMTGRCKRCGQYFYYTRNGMHSRARETCDTCRPLHKRELARERKRRQRSGQQSRNVRRQSVTARRNPRHGTEREIVIVTLGKFTNWYSGFTKGKNTE